MNYSFRAMKDAWFSRKAEKAESYHQKKATG